MTVNASLHKAEENLRQNVSIRIEDEKVDFIRKKLEYAIYVKVVLDP